MDKESVMRIIEVFADDIFQYAYPRRVNVLYYRDPKNIDYPEGVPPVFHPHIGMSVLCESQRQQQDLFTWFGLYYTSFTADRRSFMKFCTSLAVHLMDLKKEGVIKRAITIASMILELGVFCHLRGKKNFKYFSGICWSEIFRYYLMEDFFGKHDWAEFKKLAEDDAHTYIAGQYEVHLDQNRVEFRTNWLRSYDVWATVHKVGLKFSPQDPPSGATEEAGVPKTDPPCGATEEAGVPKTDPPCGATEEAGVPNTDPPCGATEEAGVPKTDPPCGATEEASVPDTGTREKKHEYEAIRQEPEGADLPLQASEPQDGGSIKMKIKLKQTPVVQNKDVELLKFKRAVYEGNYSSELFKLIECDQEMKVLMNSTVFRQVVTDTVENSEDRIENENILELMKILLLGNEDLAVFFLKATRFITLTNTIGSMRSDILGAYEYTPESGAPSTAATPLKEASNADTLPEDGKPRRELGAIPKRARSGVDKVKAFNKAYVKLIGDFKRAISTGTDLEGVEICEILESKDYVYVLLENHVFRSMMELTVKFPGKLRWGNRWILSFIKSLINASSIVPKLSQASNVQTVGTSKRQKSKRRTRASRAARAAKTTPLDKLSDTQNPPSSSSDPSLADPNTNLCPPDSDNSREPEDMSAVFVDIVNLSSNVKQLLVDVLQEKDVCEFKDDGSLPSFNFVIPCGLSLDPQNESKSKKNKKQRNRRRNIGGDSKSFSSPLTKTSCAPVKEAVKSPKSVEETCVRSAAKSIYDDSDSNDENSLENLRLRMIELGFDVTPQKSDKPVPNTWSKTADLQQGKALACIAYEELAEENVALAATLAEETTALAASLAGESAYTAPPSEETNRGPNERHSSLQSASDFRQIFNLMPPSSSNAIFDFLLQQVMETNPRFLETLKEQNCINEAEMDELTKHLDMTLSLKQESKMSGACEKANRTDKEQTEDSSSQTAILPPSGKSSDPGALDKTASPSHSSKELSPPATEKSPKASGTSEDERFDA